MDIHFTEQALYSLDDVLYFLKYKQRLPSKKVKNIKTAILNGAKSLQPNPFKGQKEPFLGHYDLEYRRVIIQHIKVIYRIEKETIIIVDIFDSRQSPDKMKS